MATPTPVCDKPYTSTDKWTASIISGLSFLIVSSPYTYSLTNMAFDAQMLIDNIGKPQIVESSGKPTVTGLVLHSFAYLLMIRIMMEKRNLAGCKKPYDSKDKWLAASLGGLMFMVIGSPILYNITNNIGSRVGFETVDDDGCPNVQGLLLHSGIFTAATRLLMR